MPPGLRYHRQGGTADAGLSDDDVGEWSYPNPLENMRKFTIAEKEMAWLTHEQIVELLADCKRQDPILALVVKIYLSTGAR